MEFNVTGSEGSGEETTGRKAGIGASPLTLRRSAATRAIALRGKEVAASASPRVRDLAASIEVLVASVEQDGA